MEISIGSSKGHHNGNDDLRLNGRLGRLFMTYVSSKSSQGKILLARESLPAGVQQRKLPGTR